MANAQAKTAEQGEGAAAAPPRKSRKLVVVAGIVLLLGGGGAAAWMTGALRGLTGGGGGGHEEGHGAAGHAAAATEPGTLELPDIVANLNTGSRRVSFVRVKARLQLTAKLDEHAVAAGTPRLLDLFQTYLRDMRPDELRGSAGLYRLREELMARANLILSPTRVTEILFVELLVQ